MAFFLVETGDCILERPGGAIGVSEQLGNCFLKIVFYSLETKKRKKKHILKPQKHQISYKHRPTIFKNYSKKLLFKIVFKSTS